MVSRAAVVPISRGFPAILGAEARVLILGSLPGRRSLEACQYYAQPQNCFWRIMGALVGAEPALPYAARLEQLRAHGVAVWDVLAAGRRPGSLDSSIVLSSIAVNDFQRLFDTQGAIHRICFNGSKAAELYRRKVLPSLGESAASIERRTLPSTSPAHASLSFHDKLARWSAALTDITAAPGRETGSFAAPSCRPRSGTRDRR